LVRAYLDAVIHRDLSLFYYRIPHLDGWFSRSLHRNEITLQETPPVRYSSAR